MTHVFQDKWCNPLGAPMLDYTHTQWGLGFSFHVYTYVVRPSWVPQCLVEQVTLFHRPVKKWFSFHFFFFNFIIIIIIFFLLYNKIFSHPLQTPKRVLPKRVVLFLPSFFAYFLHHLPPPPYYYYFPIPPLLAYLKKKLRSFAGTRLCDEAEDVI